MPYSSVEKRRDVNKRYRNKIKAADPTKFKKEQADNWQLWAKRNPGYFTSDRRKKSKAASFLKRKYGLSQDDYKALVDRYPVCPLCNQRKKLCVDHDHSSGVVRGLLCLSCNFKVGHYENVKEDITRIEAYLNGY